MKNTRLSIVLLALMLALVLMPAGTRVACAEPSDALRAVYDAMLADGSSFSRTRNVIRDFDDGSSLEVVLEDNGISITETEWNEDSGVLESETWRFVQEGDWLTVTLGAEDNAYGGMASVVLDAVLSAQGVNPNLFIGALNAMPELRSQYYLVEEGETETKVSINIAAPCELDMEALSELALTEDHLRENGWTALTEDYDAPSIYFGKVQVRCFGNEDGVEISVLEYGGLDELALKAVVSAVRVLQPQGWETFISSYTELKDADGTDYVAMVDPEDDEELFIILRDGYSTAYFAIGTIDYTDGEEAPDYSAITAEAIAAANDMQSLLARHKSVFLAFSSSDSDEESYVYVDADYLYQKIGITSVIFDQDAIWQIDDVDGERHPYYYWFAMDADEEAEMRTTPSDFAFIDSVNASRETVESIQDNGDGTLTVTTLLNAEDTAESMSYYGQELPEGATKAEERTEYVVDANTLENTAGSTTMVIDGEDAYVDSVKVTYDVDRPEEILALEAFLEDLENGAKTDPRTVKIIYDYGTETEQSYELEVDRDFRVITCARLGYDYQYSDPEKTEVYGGDDGSSVVTIYAFTEG